MPERSHRGYRPDIDGLRGVAVLPVVLFHAGVAGFGGGYVGVDVFFVVSGYLITSIILSGLDDGTFTLSDFYERRIRRIFPALFVVLAASLPPALVILVPEHLEDFGQSVIAAALFVSNFFFHLEDGYFEGPAELHPLLHTWSLAVEEQFYLAFPLLMIFLTRRKLNCGKFLAGLALASFCFGVWQLSTAPSAAFYLLPGRFWELMLGALLAVSGASRTGLSRTLSASLVVVGLVMIGFAIHYFDERTPFPGVAALLPCLGTVLVIWGGRTANPVTAILAASPLRGIGLISYSLYLWHFPLIVFARHLIVRPFTVIEVTVLVLASIALALVTWRYVEQPFRVRPRRVQRDVVLRSAAVAIGLSVAFGLFTDFSDGAPARMSNLASTFLEAREDRDTSCMRRGRNCDIGNAPGRPRYLVWGDSHANSMLPAFRHLSAQNGVNGRAALRGGCAPLIGYRLSRGIAESCANHVQTTFDAIIQSDLQVVFLGDRWTLAIEETTFGFESGTPQVMLDAAAPDSGAPNFEVMARSLQQTLTALVAAGKEVVIIGPVPEIGWHVPHTLAHRERFGGWLSDSAINPTLEIFLARNQRTIALLQRMANAHGARLLLPHEALCSPAAGCAVLQGTKPLYFDTDHLTKTGALRLVELLRPEFERLQANAD